MSSKLILIGSVIALSACTSAPTGETDRRATGALIGAIGGALIGAQVDDDDGNSRDGVLLGAIAGAAAGAGIGAMMDRQQAEFEEELAAEQRRNEIEIERVRDDLLKVTFNNEVTFDVNSTEIRPAFESSLIKVADVLTKYGSQADIVGHTDSSGSSSYNQDLSERRAQAVNQFMQSRGVARNQLTSSGEGEMQPRASNDTESGRQLNRRVEIFVRPAS